MLVGMAHRPLAALFSPASVAVVGASHDPEKWDFRPAEMGLIAQGVTVSLEIVPYAVREGLGSSRIVSLGTHADAEAADLIEEFAHHDATPAIALYIEDFRDGRAFARAAAAAGK